jgi:hypothetical protein
MQIDSIPQLPPAKVGGCRPYGERGRGPHSGGMSETPSHPIPVPEHNPTPWPAEPPFSGQAAGPPPQWNPSWNAQTNPAVPPQMLGPRRQTWWDRIHPQNHPAAWLAGVGSLLVMVAAVTSTIAQWASISIPQRLAMLVAIHAALIAGSVFGRKSLPSVSTVVAYLGSALFIATGISTTAALGGSWRTCIVVGGTAVIVAAEGFSRWWKQRLMVALDVAGVALVCAGVAAISHGGQVHLPVGVTLAIAAAGAFALKSTRRAATLAALSCGVPILTLLGDRDIGPGTIVELGAARSTLGWAAPLAGLLSAAVFAGLRKRTNQIQFLVASGVSLGFGALVGAVAGQWFVNVSPIPLAALAMMLIPNLAMHYASRMHTNDPRLDTFAVFADTFEIAGLMLLLGQSVPFLALGVPVWILSITRKRGMTIRMVPEILAVINITALAVRFSHKPDISMWTLIIGGLLIARVESNKVLERLAVIALPIAAALQLVGFTPVGNRFTVGIALMAVGVAATVWSYVNSHRFTGLLFGASAMSVAAVLIEDHGVIQGGVFFVVAATIGAIAIQLRSQLLAIWATGTAVCGAAVALAVGVGATNMGKTDANVLVGLLGLAVIEFLWHRQKDVSAASTMEFLLSSVATSAYFALSMLTDYSSGRLALSLGVALLMLAAGAIQKHTAPMVAGVGLSVLTLVVAGREELAAMPLWVWVLAGGLGLIGLATGVERRARLTR